VSADVATRILYLVLALATFGLALSGLGFHVGSQKVPAGLIPALLLIVAGGTEGWLERRKAKWGKREPS
jgi:hypothetical protein